MSNVWDADVELTQSDALGLIEGQFPQLKPVTISHLGQGWDNTAYLVNERFVFRFPRRQLAETLIVNETQSLRAIRGSLMIPVPDPCFEGNPSDTYPYHFAGYRRLDGEPACRLPLTDHDRAELAEPLAGFLAELHRIPVDDATREWAPTDTIRRADLAWRLPMVVMDAIELGPIMALHGVDSKSVVEALRGLECTGAAVESTCWVHGDFYSCHILVDEHAKLVGAIDWGDVHLGDRALDLSIVYSFLPVEARDRFWVSYDLAMGRPSDHDLRNRARFRAIHYGVVLLKYATHVSSDHPLGTAIYALHASVASDSG